ncbi:hypothetical protein BGY98DRAFT_1180469 [Russula aff. rugulosa BPL654]|nr:hypothetical protein BGY98DRAFT_1180469 [Russula aff. rugulosa BPL654]
MPAAAPNDKFLGSLLMRDNGSVTVQLVSGRPNGLPVTVILISRQESVTGKLVKAPTFRLKKPSPEGPIATSNQKNQQDNELVMEAQANTRNSQSLAENPENPEALAELALAVKLVAVRSLSNFNERWAMALQAIQLVRCRRREASCNNRVQRQCKSNLRMTRMIRGVQYGKETFDKPSDSIVANRARVARFTRSSALYPSPIFNVIL